MLCSHFVIGGVIVEKNDEFILQTILTEQRDAREEMRDFQKLTREELEGIKNRQLDKEDFNIYRSEMRELVGDLTKSVQNHAKEIEKNTNFRIGFWNGVKWISTSVILVILSVLGTVTAGNLQSKAAQDFSTNHTVISAPILSPSINPPSHTIKVPRNGN